MLIFDNFEHWLLYYIHWTEVATFQFCFFWLSPSDIETNFAQVYAL